MNEKVTIDFSTKFNKAFNNTAVQVIGGAALTGSAIFFTKGDTESYAIGVGIKAVTALGKELLGDVKYLGTFINFFDKFTNPITYNNLALESDRNLHKAYKTTLFNTTANGLNKAVEMAIQHTCNLFYKTENKKIIDNHLFNEALKGFAGGGVQELTELGVKKIMKSELYKELSKSTFQAMSYESSKLLNNVTQELADKLLNGGKINGWNAIEKTFAMIDYGKFLSEKAPGNAVTNANNSRENTSNDENSNAKVQYLAMKVGASIGLIMLTEAIKAGAEFTYDKFSNKNNIGFQETSDGDYQLSHGQSHSADSNTTKYNTEYGIDKLSVEFSADSLDIFSENPMENAEFLANHIENIA